MASLPISFRQGSRWLWYRNTVSFLPRSTTPSSASSPSLTSFSFAHHSFRHNLTSSSASSAIILPILYKYLPSLLSSGRTTASSLSPSFSLISLNTLSSLSSALGFRNEQQFSSSLSFVLSSLLTDMNTIFGNGIWTMNRNAREPRKANNGARPCSNVRRKRKLLRRANPHPYIPGKKKKGYDI